MNEIGIQIILVIMSQLALWLGFLLESFLSGQIKNRFYMLIISSA